MKFGIDLGTTYSSIGYYNPETHLVELAQLNSAQGPQGPNLLPSAVFLEGTDPQSGKEKVVVGNAATNAGLDKPDRIFRWFKQSMVIDPLPSYEVDGRRWTPVEFSAEVLKTLAAEASRYWGGLEVKEVVVTYPAFFNPREKELTRQAVVDAGLTVIEMLEEPQAAALAYVIDQVLSRAKQEAVAAVDLDLLMPKIIDELAGAQRGVLVYDLGGGTFDMALVQAEGASAGANTQLQLKTLTHDGDINLGGRNWDETIKQMVQDIAQREFQYDPSQDPQAARLDDECELKKKDLSSVATAKIPLFCPKLHQVEISLETVRKHTAGLLDKTRRITAELIQKASDQFGIPKQNLLIVLSGGMCRWKPAVEMLTELMDGRAPICHRNVDFMVTYGAAYRAYLAQTIKEQQAGEAPRQVTVPGTNYGLVQPQPGAIGGDYPAIGVQVVDREDPVYRTDPGRARSQVSRVIPSGSTVGDYHEEEFAKVYPDQDAVDIVIHCLRPGRKDEEKELDAWQEYKTFRLSNLPKGAGQGITVRLRYQSGGMIDGVAWDQSGQEVKIEGHVAGR